MAMYSSNSLPSVAGRATPYARATQHYPRPSSRSALLDSDAIQLRMRQEPEEALMMAPNKEKNRKPIDPPPIVEMIVTTEHDPTAQYLNSPYLFCIATVVSDQAVLAENGALQTGQELKDALVGQTSSSLHKLKDASNQDAGFFVFGDLSMRLSGSYKLMFSLFEIDKTTMTCFMHKSIVSRAFNTCASHKDWRGLQESTYLSRTFADQGVKLRLRKDPKSIAVPQNKRGYEESQPYAQQSQAYHQPQQNSLKRTYDHDDYYSQGYYSYDNSAHKRQQMLPSFDYSAAAVLPSPVTPSPYAAMGMMQQHPAQQPPVYPSTYWNQT